MLMEITLEVPFPSSRLRHKEDFGSIFLSFGESCSGFTNVLKVACMLSESVYLRLPPIKWTE